MLAELDDILHIVRHPDAAVITQGLGHQGELALLVAVDRNTGRVDLREAGVCEESALAVGLHRGGAVGVHRVRGQEIGISVTTGSEDHGVGAEALDLTGHEVAGDDTLRLAVDDDEVQHLVARIALHGAGGDFLVQGRISAEKQLLTGLSAGVEGTAHLDTAEGAVRQISAVFTGERNALRDALVDDGRTYLRQAIHVRLPGTVVTALDGVVEQPVDGVIVVLVVLRGVDTALCGDGVRAARRVGDAENLDVVSELAQGGGCGCSAEARTDDDHLEFPLVVRRDDPDFGLALRPFLGERPFRNLGDKFRVSHISLK